MNGILTHLSVPLWEFTIQVDDALPDRMLEGHFKEIQVQLLYDVTISLWGLVCNVVTE